MKRNDERVQGFKGSRIQVGTFESPQKRAFEPLNPRILKSCFFIFLCVFR